MTTAIAAIVTALVANLSAPVAVSANIHRTYLGPLPDTETTAVVVRPLSSMPERNQLGGNPIDMTTQVAVECYARTTSTTADLAVDVVLEAVFARLMADQTLGGTVMNINFTELQFGMDADAQQFAVATLTLEVRHRTSGLTLT